MKIPTITWKREDGGVLCLVLKEEKSPLTIDPGSPSEPDWWYSGQSPASPGLQPHPALPEQGKKKCTYYKNTMALAFSTGDLMLTLTENKRT